MRTRSLAFVPAALAAGALAGCGGDATSSAEETKHETATPAVALREAGETRDALQAALATYKRGDKAAAEEQVAETYVQHFEEVEGPLNKIDHELNEHLEEAISGELRAIIRSGKPVSAVEAAFQAVFANLRKAEAALR